MLLINPKRKTPAGSSPFSSPLKKKKKGSKDDDNNDNENDDSWDLQCTQVDTFDDLQATQVDFLDESYGEEKETHAFKLNAFGDDDVVSFVDEKEIACKWSSDPFCVGRIKFLQMPDEHKNRISRKHFEIHCSNNPDTNAREYWLVDFSANGTMIDGEIGYSGKKTLLEDGSAIGILLTPSKDRVLFGYLFSTAGDNNNNSNFDNNKNKLKTQLQKITNINNTLKTTTKQVKNDIKPPTNGTKQNGTKQNETQVSGEKEKEKEKETEKKMNGVFVIPSPKPRTTPTTKTTTTTITTKSKSGLFQGLRFSLVGYDEAALSDPKKKKLIKDLCDQGASYVMHPDATNVDVVVLNRFFFKDPTNYNVNLPTLTSSLHIRFLGNTRYLEDCVASKRQIDFRSSHAHEILPPKSGGVIVLANSENSTNLPKGSNAKNSIARGFDPSVVGQLASMLRDEKANGAKWKVLASLSTISSCGGMLEGLEGVVEVLKSGEKEKGDGELDFMLGICETHAAGYRHTLLLVNKKDKTNKGVQKMEKVVTVVDAAGFTSFAQNLNKQRKKQKDEK